MFALLSTLLTWNFIMESEKKFLAFCSNISYWDCLCYPCDLNTDKRATADGQFNAIQDIKEHCRGLGEGFKLKCNLWTICIFLPQHVVWHRPTDCFEKMSYHGHFLRYVCKIYSVHRKVLVLQYTINLII